MTQSAQPNRRTIVSGAAWTIPVLALSAAAPLSAASTPCVPLQDLNTLNADFVRAGTGGAYFRWRNVFRPGDELRLNVVATKVSTGAGDIAAPNLTLETAPAGSTFGLVVGATSAMRLSVNTNQAWLEVHYEFSFSYSATGGTQQPFTGVSNNVFRITDIDGFSVAENGPKGAERVSVISGASGTINDNTYLMGDGTFADPWARRDGTTPVDIDTFTTGRGNVVMNAPASTWSIRYRTNNTGNANNPQSYNMWITPITFRAVNPTAC